MPLIILFMHLFIIAHAHYSILFMTYYLLLREMQNTTFKLPGCLFSKSAASISLDDDDADDGEGRGVLFALNLN